MPICVRIVYGCFCATMAELSSCDRGHMAGKVRNIYSGSLQKKFVDACPRLSVYDSIPMTVVCSSVRDPGLNVWTYEQLRKLAVPSAASG